MSQAEVERFVEDLKNDEGLRSELSAHASGVGSVVAFAKDKGYDVTADEASAYINAQAGRELSDDELDAVAGGKGADNQHSNSQVSANTNVAASAEAVVYIAAVAAVVLS